MERRRRWRNNDNCRDVTALFRFIARLGNGLLRIYVGAIYLGALIPSLVRFFVLPQPPRFFGRGTFIKGYRGVTEKQKRVLTIGRSSEVISNNPFPAAFPFAGHLLAKEKPRALKSTIGVYDRRSYFRKTVRAPVIVFPSWN